MWYFPAGTMTSGGLPLPHRWAAWEWPGTTWEHWIALPYSCHREFHAEIPVVVHMGSASSAAMIVAEAGQAEKASWQPQRVASLERINHRPLHYRRGTMTSIFRQAAGAILQGCGAITGAQLCPHWFRGLANISSQPQSGKTHVSEPRHRLHPDTTAT